MKPTDWFTLEAKNLLRTDFADADSMRKHVAVKMKTTKRNEILRKKRGRPGQQQLNESFILSDAQST